MSGLPLFGVCTGLGMSPLYARHRAAATLVSEVCFRHLRWIGEWRSSSSPYVCGYYEGLDVRHYQPLRVLTQPGGFGEGRSSSSSCCCNSGFGGLLPPPSLDRRREVVIKSVRVRVLRGAGRAALSTPQGANTARGLRRREVVIVVVLLQLWFRRSASATFAGSEKGGRHQVRTC